MGSRPRAPKGLKVSVSPSSFSVPAGGTFTVSITVDGSTAGSGWSFGAVNLTSTAGKAPSATIPVAALPGQGAVAMTHSCAPKVLAVNAGSHCSVSLTNTASVPAPASLSLTAPARVTVRNVGAPATATGTSGFTWAGTLTPSLPPTITSITAGGSPAGYLPLSLFGITPIAGMGDETIVNFDVPQLQVRRRDVQPTRHRLQRLRRRRWWRQQRQQLLQPRADPQRRAAQQRRRAVLE